MKPYSLYAYRTFDGRVSFSVMPRPKCNQICVNIRQLSVYWNQQRPDVDCTLVVLSFEPNCKIDFDARYVFQDCEPLIEEGNPFVIEISKGIISVSTLDANQFFGKY